MKTIEYNISPKVLIDEVSEDLIYIGTSINGSNENNPIWRINRINKRNGIWYITEYPNAKQSFDFIWSERVNYTYL